MKKINHKDMYLPLATFIYLTILPFTANSRYVKCPLPPVCNWGCDYRRKAIDCSGAMLGPYSPEIPDRHEDTSWSADFSHNSISIISNMAFFVHIDEVIRFHFLNYSHNTIRTIEPKAFLGLEKDLHTLILDYNKLEGIPEKAIGNLTHLRVLSLTNNKLVSLDFVCSNTIPRLHKLNVANNMLSEISPSCFYGTRLGKTEESSLVLANNNIKYFDACTFQGRQFQLLDYTNNTLICMCEMSWLKEYDFDGTLMCQHFESNETMPMQTYIEEKCESINIDQIQCVDMVVNATYKETSFNESEVHVNWQTKDPHMSHMHATIYSFREGKVSNVGHYKLHHSKSELGLTIKVSRDYGNELIICIEVPLSKQDGLNDSAAPQLYDEQLSPLGSPGGHVQCQMVSVPDPPEFLIGYLKSSSTSISTQYLHTFLVLTTLISILLYLNQ